MKLSNFVFKAIYKGYPFDVVRATVDVSTGFWIFKQTVTKNITAPLYYTDCGGNWEFDDTGLYTPGVVVENMYADYLETLHETT